MTGSRYVSVGTLLEHRLLIVVLLAHFDEGPVELMADHSLLEVERFLVDMVGTR